MKPTETIGLKALRFLHSIGHYGTMVGGVMAVIGLFKWDKVYIVVGLVGAALSFGWMALFDLIIAKAQPRS